MRWLSGKMLPISFILNWTLSAEWGQHSKLTSWSEINGWYLDWLFRIMMCRSSSPCVLNISDKQIFHINRCRCWVWVATIRSLATWTYRLLLHSWCSPWRPPRVRLQARCKGNELKCIVSNVFLIFVYRMMMNSNDVLMPLLTGYLGWYDWRNLHADGYFVVGHLENWLEQRGRNS